METTTNKKTISTEEINLLYKEFKAYQFNTFNFYDEDCSQQAMLAVIENYHTFNPEKSLLKTWGCTILRNIFIQANSYKFNRRKRLTDSINNLYEDTKDEIDITSSYIKQQIIDEDSQNNEIKLTDDIIEYITTSKLYPITEMKIKGIKYSDIADILNIPYDTVSSLLRRERVQLFNYCKDNIENNHLILDRRLRGVKKTTTEIEKNIKERTCVVCNSTFHSSRKKVVCSDNCRRIRNNQIWSKCSKKNYKYIKVEVRKKTTYKITEVNCKECNILFNRKCNRAVYCSDNCRSIGAKKCKSYVNRMTEPFKRNCQMCNKEFETYDRSKCCSKECLDIRKYNYQINYQKNYDRNND